MVKTTKELSSFEECIPKESAGCLPYTIGLFIHHTKPRYWLYVNNERGEET